jgi:peptidoglycan/LPS O-acetylase OafA/YrhL
MQIMAVYVVFVIVGEFGSYLIGRAVEAYSKTAGLPVFLTCFFLVFGIAWILAVKVTEPKKKHS